MKSSTPSLSSSLLETMGAQIFLQIVYLLTSSPSKNDALTAERRTLLENIKKAFRCEHGN